MAEDSKVIDGKRIAEDIRREVKVLLRSGQSIMLPIKLTSGLHRQPEVLNTVMRAVTGYPSYQYHYDLAARFPEPKNSVASS